MTAMIKGPPRRRRGEETRARLMEAATGVFARSGFDRATVDEIVREAGFSKGAFYVHFESKEDLFWAMLEERISRQQDTFRRAVGPTHPAAHNRPPHPAGPPPPRRRHVPQRLHHPRLRRLPRHAQGADYGAGVAPPVGDKHQSV